MGYDVAQFIFTDGAIKKFRRWVKKPRDCVINAMELLGILDEQNADIARILIGDVGAQIKQIEDIFTIVEPAHNWNFFKFTNIQTLAQFTTHELKPQHAIFCGYTGDEGHVFLIAKGNLGGGRAKKSKVRKSRKSKVRNSQKSGATGGYNDNKVYYIDPQVDAVCNLDIPKCFNFIDKKNAYFILQHQPKQ